MAPDINSMASWSTDGYSTNGVPREGYEIPGEFPSSPFPLATFTTAKWPFRSSVKSRCHCLGQSCVVATTAPLPSRCGRALPPAFSELRLPLLEMQPWVDQAGSAVCFLSGQPQLHNDGGGNTNASDVTHSPLHRCRSRLSTELPTMLHMTVLACKPARLPIAERVR
jgi:hypothetical protein